MRRAALPDNVGLFDGASKQRAAAFLLPTPTVTASTRPQAILSADVLTLLVVALTITAILGVVFFFCEYCTSRKTTPFPKRLVPGMGFGMFYELTIMLGLDFAQGQVQSKPGRAMTMAWKCVAERFAVLCQWGGRCTSH